MVKSTKKIVLIVALVLLLAFSLAFVFVKEDVSFQEYNLQSFRLFPTTFATTEGGVELPYYAEQCEDISQYTAAKGYTLGIDANNCPTAEKRIEASRVYFGYFSQNYFWTPDGRSVKGSGSGSDKCAQFVGSMTIDNPKKPGTAQNECYGVVYTIEKHGGLTRVQGTCQLAQNDLLAAETFKAGTTFTKMDVRYPVKSWCKAIPALITVDATKTINTSTNVYDVLANGGSITVGSGETITVFYVMENNYNLPTVCGQGTTNMALDVRSNLTACRSTIGFTYFCTEGIFDAEQGACVSQSDSPCEEGYRLDLATRTCVKNQPLQAVCGVGEYFSVDRNQCVASPINQFVCGAQYDLYLPLQPVCGALGGVWLICPQCPADKVCDANICKPQCSIGNQCEAKGDLRSLCDDVNGSISTTGRCVYEEDGQRLSFRICAQNEYWDNVRKKCAIAADSQQVCANGQALQVNPLTNRPECPGEDVNFVQCATDQVYSTTAQKCVDSIDVYIPQNDTTIIYKEIRGSCTSDSQCPDGLVCSQYSAFGNAYGVCRTPLGTQPDYTLSFWVGVALSVGLFGVLFILQKKKIFKW